MTVQVLLVDSNVYLRLARHIPQFFQGTPDYALRTVAEADNELRSPRIRGRFAWTRDDPYPAERLKWRLPVTKAQALAIAASKATVLEFAEATLAEALPNRKKFSNAGAAMPYLSPVDLELLCHAIHFQHGLLTDEAPLKRISKEYDVPVITSLQLLRYFMGQKVVDMKQVEAIVQFWMYDKDVPHKDWTADYKKLFKKPPPSPVLG